MVVTNRPTKKKPAVPEPSGAKPIAFVLAGIGLIVLIVSLFHFYVKPLTGQFIPHKVAPLPGFPDMAPYNTAEWQERFKSGKAFAPTLSGIPRSAMPGAGGEKR